MAVPAARFALVACLAAACISAKDFDPTFYIDEWEGVCANGTAQTPIIIYDKAAQANPVPRELVTDMTFPVVTGLSLVNVGNGLQFDFADIDMDSLPTVRAGGDSISAVLLDPSIPVDREVKVQPVQFHLHSVSEHVVDGLYYAAESHIVSLVARGEAPDWGCDAVWDGGEAVLDRCAAVFGTLFKLADDPALEPKFLAPNYAVAPEVVDDEASFPATVDELDLNILIPTDKSYYTYSGSLTTPPCTEGLRWHVFSEPRSVTPATMEAIQNYAAFSTNDDGSDILGYRTNNRLVLPLNGRTVLYYKDPSGPQPRAPPDCMMAGPATGMYGATGAYGEEIE